MNLKDKVVVITGASSGIGKAVAVLCAIKGAKVVLAARNEAALKALEADIKKAGGVALAVKTDVAKRDAMERLAKTAMDTFGALNVFINNAGVTHPDVPLLDLPEPEVRRVMETNFMASVTSVWAAVPFMEKSGGGILAFVTSIIGKRGIPTDSIYCASKFATQGLAESIRPELKKKNIRVLTLLPPGVDTPFFEANGRGVVRRFRLHSVDKIGRLIVRALEKETRESILTFDAKLLHALNIFFPAFTDWAVAKNKGL